jgi:hypothetical protein
MDSIRNQVPVVVHIQNATLAGSAVMSPFGFIDVADHAVFFAPILGVVHEIALS